MRGVIGADTIDRAVGQACQARFHIAPAAQRRAHFEVRVEAAQAFVGEREMMRADLRGHAHLAQFCPANDFHAAAAGNVHHMDPPAGGFGQQDVAADHHIFRRAGHAGQTQQQRNEPLVHHAPLGQFAHFGMIENWAVEHQRIFERPPHQFGVVNRRPVVGETDRAGLNELAELGKFLPFAIFADAGDDVHVALIGPRRLMLNEFDAGLRIDRRLGIGHAGDRGKSAGQCRRGAGGDRFIFLAPGSRRWTCMSISPGETILPVASMIRSCPLGETS